MLGRLKRCGFIEADRVGKQRDETMQRDKTVVRVRHPVHGWMYEKLSEDDDPAVDAWAKKANAPKASRRPVKVGEK